jgi:hypothetical protein
MEAKMEAKTRTLILRFSCPVAQISPHEISLIAAIYDGPIFHSEAIDVLAAGLSDADKDRLSDDASDFLQNEAIRRSIRIS